MEDLASFHEKLRRLGIFGAAKGRCALKSWHIERGNIGLCDKMAPDRALASCLDDVELKPETKLAEVGLDSMSTVEAVMACEDEFGIEIDPEANPQTIQEFVDLVEAQL